MDNAQSKDNKTKCNIVSAGTAVRFLCLFIVAYVVLMSPWPGLDRGYTHIYRGALIFLSKSLAPDGTVRFEQSPDPQYDFALSFYHRSKTETDSTSTEVGFFGQNCRRDAYIFVAFIASLVIATPLGWKRKILTLIWCMLAVHIFLAFKLAIWIFYGLSNEPFLLFANSRFLTGALNIIKEICVRNLNFGLIVCTLIWAAVSFAHKLKSNVNNTQQS